MSKPALVIMTRIPSAQGKSRLSSILTSEQREELQWAFLWDTLDKVSQVPGAKYYVAATPANQIFELKQALRPGTEIIPQAEGDLGQRMLAVINYIFNLGHSPVILIGTDAPLLPVTYLTEAIRFLSRHQLVFGPALDGGYYLIGMGHPMASIFKDIIWGGEGVLEKTIDICEQQKLSYCLLAPLGDVDRPEDLLALTRQTKNENIGCEEISTRTMKFLRTNL